MWTCITEKVTERYWVCYHSYSYTYPIHHLPICRRTQHAQHQSEKPQRCDSKNNASLHPKHQDSATAGVHSAPIGRFSHNSNFFHHNCLLLLLLLDGVLAALSRVAHRPCGSGNRIAHSLGSLGRRRLGTVGSLRGSIPDCPRSSGDGFAH